MRDLKVAIWQKNTELMLLSDKYVLRFVFGTSKLSSICGQGIIYGTQFIKKIKIASLSLKIGSITSHFMHHATSLIARLSCVIKRKDEMV